MHLRKNPRRRRPNAVFGTFGGQNTLKLSENNFRAANPYFSPHCNAICKG
jgi:hypothetical protein